MHSSIEKANPFSRWIILLISTENYCKKILNKNIFINCKFISLIIIFNEAT